MVHSITASQLQRLGLEILDVSRPEEQQQMLLRNLLKVIPGVVAGEIQVDRVTARSAVMEQPEQLATDAATSAAMLPTTQAFSTWPVSVSSPQPG